MVNRMGGRTISTVCLEPTHNQCILTLEALVRIPSYPTWELTVMRVFKDKPHRGGRTGSYALTLRSLVTNILIGRMRTDADGRLWENQSVSRWEIISSRDAVVNVIPRY